MTIIIGITHALEGVLWRSKVWAFCTQLYELHMNDCLILNWLQIQAYRYMCFE